MVSKVETNPIRVSGARNGVDGSGRDESYWAKQQRVVGTCLSGFEMGIPGRLQIQRDGVTPPDAFPHGHFFSSARPSASFANLALPFCLYPFPRFSASLNSFK